MTLGNAIKLIRTARGISQRNLAEKLEISSNYLSLIETDKRDPSLSFLRRLSATLRVPVATFFMFQGEPVLGVSPNDVEKLQEMLLQLDRMIVQSRT